MFMPTTLVFFAMLGLAMTQDSNECAKDGSISPCIDANQSDAPVQTFYPTPTPTGIYTPTNQVTDAPPTAGIETTTPTAIDEPTVEPTPLPNTAVEPTIEPTIEPSIAPSIAPEESIPPMSDLAVSTVVPMSTNASTRRQTIQVPATIQQQTTQAVKIVGQPTAAPGTNLGALKAGARKSSYMHPIIKMAGLLAGLALY
ncbi:hypothetical protein SeLEV6574_g08148 [Synchytrium endobioticum]|uniref:Uncharacterized protein n=2 Tax=Synchytrium endobioticum TaxID=286115 RepID=A0A507CCP9_9FUNG|nr:hypothetical protein SeLEV6574_g08148 [Synchytrium endobioticum]